MHPATIESAHTALRTGSVSAVELLDAAFAAIDTWQSRTNAFTRVHRESARAAAREADAERAQGIDRGPLHGIPISLKDLIDERGMVTTAGSRVLDGRVAEADAPVCVRLREAGAVILGRTNLHEFALGTTSEDSAFGPVRHPADPERSAGGSSGGSAAAVATGMGLASIGTDTGGLVRIPAAACGLVGLKPSREDVPTAGVIPLSTTLDHVGPIARSVTDAWLLYGVLAGRTTSPGPVALKGTRLSVLNGYFGSTDDGVARDFRDALDRLVDGGVELATNEIAGTNVVTRTYTNIVLPEAAHWHAPFLDTKTGDYQPAVRARILDGRGIPATAYVEALEACRTLAAAVDQALATADALVLPTLPIVAPRLGSADVELAGTRVPVRAAMLKHTQLFNLTGHPAITLPVQSSGLPVGLQLVGRRGRTEDLLAIALACERLLSESAS